MRKREKERVKKRGRETREREKEREREREKKKKEHPAVVAWSVERLLHKKCHLLAVDLILLGEVYMVKF